MEACIVPVFEQRSFSSQGGTPASPNTTVIHRALPLLDHAAAELEVRVHGWTTIGASSGPTATVRVRASAPSPEQPTANFVAPMVLAAARVDSSVVAPLLLRGILPRGSGPALWIDVVVTAASDGSYMVASLSADLIVRKAPALFFRQVIPFAYGVAGGTSHVFLYFTDYGASFAATPPVQATYVAPFAGLVEEVWAYPNNTTSAVMYFYKNGSATAIASESLDVTSAGLARFRFRQDTSFARGERIHLGFDPVLAVTANRGSIILRSMELS